MPKITIADAAAQLLAEHRVLAARALGQLVAAQGLTRAKDPARAVTRALDLDPRFRRLSDDRWVVPGQLLDGVTLAHRLTAAEVRAGVLAMVPDLSPLMAIELAELRLHDGRPLTPLWHEDAAEATGIDADAAVRGPARWLDGFQAGQLLHARLVDGRLQIEPGAQPRAATRLTVRRLVEAARRRLAEQEADGGAFPLLPPAVLLEGLVLDHLADDPMLLEPPLPPLGEAFADAGLEVHGSWVGLPGTDWDALDDFMSLDPDDEDDDGIEDELAQEMLEALDLEPDELDGFRVVLAALELSKRPGGPGTAAEARETNERLARIVAKAGVTKAMAIQAWIDADLEPFVAGIVAAATGRGAAGPRFVAGACAEARDDVVTAERWYRAALDADPDHPLALIEVARYDTDRGDYAAALQHLRRARVSADDSERAWLEQLIRPAVPKVGRNDPCPCGSGRKYKSCHLDAPQVASAVAPARALMHKLDAWLSQPNMQRLGDEALDDAVADARPDASDGERQGAGDSLIADIVLWERDGLRRFLEVRGALLPPAERALGESWLGSRRSLYEVVSTRRGSGLAVRDLLADGDPIELADRTMSAHSEPLDLFCLRLVPDGVGGLTVFGGISVPRGERRRAQDLMADGDGMALLRWVVMPPPPPKLVNMEGEPLRLVAIAYRLPDPTATATALARQLRDDGDGRFSATVDRRGQTWDRGSITIEGDTATIEANSAPRAARLERTLRKAAPGARLIRREERGIEEARDDDRAGGKAAPAMDPAAIPGMAAALDDYLRRAEASWVDERIPALGGLTPRQAMADPSARAELEALLDDMAWQQRRAGGQGMDPARIRALLALSDRPH